MINLFGSEFHHLGWRGREMSVAIDDHEVFLIAVKIKFVCFFRRSILQKMSLLSIFVINK